MSFVPFVRIDLINQGVEVSRVGVFLSYKLGFKRRYFVTRIEIWWSVESLISEVYFSSALAVIWIDVIFLSSSLILLSRSSWTVEDIAMDNLKVYLVSMLIWELLILAVDSSGLTIGMVFLPRRVSTNNNCSLYMRLDQVTDNGPRSNGNTQPHSIKPA